MYLSGKMKTTKLFLKTLIQTVLTQTYYLLLTDALGCPYDDTVFVDQPQEIEVAEEIVNINCFGENTGSIEVEVSGGTASYQYVWSNGLPDNNTVIGLFAGTYDLTIIDANDCQKEVSYEVEQEDQIIVSDTGEFISCTEGIAKIEEIVGGVSLTRFIG